jgi:hypothetical protein
MKVKGPILAVIGLAAAGVAGCSSTPSDPKELALEMQQKQQEAQLQAIKEVVDQAPSWYVSPPSDSGYMFGAGTATSGDLQFAIDKASLNAKRAVADQVHSKLSADFKDYLEESGGSLAAAAAVHDERTVHNVVAEVDLQGYEVVQRKVVPSGSGYRAFILVRYSIAAAAQQMSAADPAKPPTDMSANLRASKAFQDLEAEIHDAQARNQAPPAGAPVQLPPGMILAPRRESAEPAEPPAPMAAPEPPVAAQPE